MNDKATHNGELFRALGALCESSDPTALKNVSDALELGEPPDASEYTELFIFQLPPYASIYVGAEGMIGGEARDRIAGFWRALGQAPPAEPDHLTTIMAMYSRVIELHSSEQKEEQKQAWRRARRAFLWEHMVSWLPCYLEKLTDLAAPFYRRWAEILYRALLAEINSIDPQIELPLHLRSAPTLLNPRECELDEFLRALLAPARSGVILTRNDLARAAREVGVSLRAGERKFVLKSLLEQDAASMFDWLSREASSWVARSNNRDEALHAVSSWWTKRAAKTESVLREMRASLT